MCPSKPLVRETVTPRVKFPPFGWELSGGGGGQGQPQEVMLQNLTLPQVWRPEGQLSRSSGQEQAPRWALFPKPHLRGPLELGL